MTELQQSIEEGRQFVNAECRRFLDSVASGTFKEDYVTKTEPAIFAKYSRVPAEYKSLHKRVWSSYRGQKIIDASDANDKWMWNHTMGYAISEHPHLTLLFIWYMPYAIVIGLDGPKCQSVVDYCLTEDRVYSSRVLYTEEEIEEFDRHYRKVVYLENYVNQ